jgi:hypothetical protein
MDDKESEKRAGYSWGEMLLLAATGILPGMIILWAYKTFIKKKD